mmetsp:Transcript_89520/g.261651  ORF Transcript_89520/g.261651 Transcript_89520/m.261651 type:complete len:243 (-) Transcript_89520:548-1276(-)
MRLLHWYHQIPLLLVALLLPPPPDVVPTDGDDPRHAEQDAGSDQHHAELPLRHGLQLVQQLGWQSLESGELGAPSSLVIGPPAGGRHLGGAVAGRPPPPVGMAADSDVAHGGRPGVAAAAAGARAAGGVVEPGHGLRVGAPVGDAQGHAGSHDVGHALQVGAAGRVAQDELLLPLLEPRHHALEDAASRGLVMAVEVGVHVEGALRVDGVATPWAEIHDSHGVGVLTAAVPVTLGVVPIVRR